MFFVQSNPDITRWSGMKNRARSIDFRSIGMVEKNFKKRDFFQIKC